MSFNNSLKIIQIIKDYYENKPTLDYSKCPPKLTRNMLLDELCIIKPDKGSDIYSLQQLWNMYCFMNNNTNSFGFKPSLSYANNRLSLKDGNKVSRSNRVSSSYSRKKYNNIVVADKRPSTSRKRSIYSTNKRTNRTHRPLFIGGSNPSKTLEVVEGLNNGTITPSWHRGWSTLLKLEDVAGTKLFLNGSSIPKDDEDECRDTFLYYKYIKGINKIISLQGCNLNWTRGDGTTVREPRDCGNKELEIWETICREYNTNTDKRGRQVITRYPCDYGEYHWVDMSGGYFDVYDKISQLEFTNSYFHTLIHCLGGLGRTGTTLLLIICKYYYRDPVNKALFNEHFGMNESDSIVEKRAQSNRIMVHLENEIFSKHIFVDGSVPDEFIENENSSMILSDKVRDKIKRDVVVFSPVEKMKEEIFTYFYKRLSRGNQISITGINTFITRINNIIYFTAKINNIDGNITLYNLYGSNNRSFPSLRVDNKLIMNSMIFIYPTTTSVAEIDALLTSPIVSESSFGFELSRLPFYSYLSDVFLPPEESDLHALEEMQIMIQEPEPSQRKKSKSKSKYFSKAVNSESCIIS